MKVIVDQRFFTDCRVRVSARSAAGNKRDLTNGWECVIRGAMLAVWHESQIRGLVRATAKQIDLWCDVPDMHKDLADGDLIVLEISAEKEEDNIYKIRGNEETLDKFNTYIEGKKAGGKASAEKRKKVAEKASTSSTPVQQMFNTSSTRVEQNSTEVNRPCKVKDRISNSYLPNFSDPEFPTNFPKNDLHNNVADTPPNSVPNDLAIVPRVKLTAKARGPARDRAIVVTNEMNEFWEEYLRGMKAIHNATPKANQHTFALIDRVCKLLGDEAIGTLRIYLQDNYPGFWRAKHSLPVFEKHVTALNVQTQNIIAWENGEAPHPDELESLARRAHNAKLRNGQI